ncbi:hypothetical protein [Bradyrhizobium sp. 144]|uniref:hypothetical protein n=1 Tax=Bradyrhizobium sp. 144 TaxID=2782620 RepID=UPI001FFAE021|nr:hypothetical protein [Bradyrhizobium sp. 144]MCK1694582.1 hypothetical protein [Bradyrhizobium sp. 144]
MTSVITYKNNGTQCFCQIAFDSGERVLISIAGMPRPSIKVLKLALGIVPTKTIWNYDLAMAGNVQEYLRGVAAMFLPDGELVHPLDVIRDLLLQCTSIETARYVLIDRFHRLGL